MDSTIQIRIDNKTKQSVAKVFKTLGLDLSSGVKIYFQKVLHTKSIPFSITTENGFTPETEKKIIRESRQTQKKYAQKKRRAHTSVKSLFAELER
jgi:addiction module RelB/DinJ family antitoxin